MKLHIEPGTKYGDLTVIKEAEKYRLPSGQTNRAMLCKCDCGNKKVIRLSHLIRLKITSCGCKNPSHGDVGSKLHTTWRAMLNRVRNVTCIDAHRYIERGITVYKPWEKYLVFKKWAIKKGYIDGLQIDRKNNDKGYYPWNCRFVTRKVNANNKEVTVMINYKGIKQALCIVLESAGLMDHYAAIRGRVERGWDHDKAIDTPIRKGKYRSRTSRKD